MWRDKTALRFLYCSLGWLALYYRYLLSLGFFVLIDRNRCMVVTIRDSALYSIRYRTLFRIYEVSNSFFSFELCSIVRQMSKVIMPQTDQRVGFCTPRTTHQPPKPACNHRASSQLRANIH